MSENRFRIGVFQGVGQFRANFHIVRKGTSPRTIFARIDKLVNALQLCRWQYSRKM